MYIMRHLAGQGFIFVMDELDCVFRVAKEQKALQKEYLGEKQEREIYGHDYNYYNGINGCAAH